MLKCSICGREITTRDLAYVKGQLIVCTSCFPRYYVRNLCPLVSRRLKGENCPACTYCRFVDECNKYIETLKRTGEQAQT